MRPKPLLHALVAVLAASGLAGLGGCETAENGALPTEAALDTLYGERVDASLNGNVVELRVRQDAEQLRRGGPIWAKAAPYIFLFTPQTRDLLTEYGGVGGVRVTTLDSRGEMIARALLERNTLTSVTWRRAINTAGRARVQGTTRPQTMVDLAEFGEEHTSYEYSQQYAGSD